MNIRKLHLIVVVNKGIHASKYATHGVFSVIVYVYVHNIFRDNLT